MTTTDIVRAAILGVDIFFALYLVALLITFTSLAFRTNKWAMPGWGFVAMLMIALCSAAFWVLGR